MKGARFQLKNGDPVSALRIGGKTSAAQLVSDSGELNAHDKKQLLRNISQLMEQSSSGGIVSRRVDPKQLLAEASHKKSILAAAINDATGVEWRKLEMALAAEISETTAREGFLRRLMMEEPVAQGDMPRVRVRMTDVIGAVADGPGEIHPQFIVGKQFFPPEFGIVINLEIDERDIAQATGDLLDEKYQEGLQAAMVVEDRLWKQGADLLVGTANPLTTIAGPLTPSYLAGVQELVQAWKLQGVNCLLAQDYWKDIMTSPSWLGTFDPVTQAEVLLTGRLGTIYGMGMNTDGFRPPELKVLEAGELYVTAAPEFHGSITTRGGIVPTPLNGAIQGRMTRGWYMSELISMFIANARSLAKAVRG